VYIYIYIYICIYTFLIGLNFMVKTQLYCNCFTDWGLRHLCIMILTVPRGCLQVQGHAVDERGAPPLPGGAGDPYHRPHGAHQLPLCAPAGLCHPQLPSGVSCEDRYWHERPTFHIAVVVVVVAVAAVMVVVVVRCVSSPNIEPCMLYDLRPWNIDHYCAFQWVRAAE